MEVDTNSDVEGEEAGAGTKCLLCLQPVAAQVKSESLDSNLIDSFVTLVTKSSTKPFGSFPKTLLTEAMENGVYCTKCLDQLGQLHFIQQKIKTLLGFMNKVEAEVEKEILTNYFKQTDINSIVQSESYQVTSLRNLFHKSKLLLQVVMYY